MSGVKGGSIVTIGNGVTVLDRIQNAGPNNLNIPVEKINELGDYQSVATIRDTPDLTFSYNSWDVSLETEALLTQQYAGRTVTDGAITASAAVLSSATAAFTSADVGRMVIIAGAGLTNGGGDLVSTIITYTDASHVTIADNAVNTVTGANTRITTNGFDLSVSQPLNLASEFKAGKDAPLPFNVVAGVALPFLYLDNLSYDFGLKSNSAQAGQLRGDTIFYCPGPVYTESFATTGASGQVIVTAHPAYQAAQGDQRRVLAVVVGNVRLAFGADYTESYGTVTAGAAVTTITITAAQASTATIRIMYSSPDAMTLPQTIHDGVSVKPAAVRGRDIEVYLGGYNPNDRVGSRQYLAGGTQHVKLDWKVTLERDEELGNYYATAQDFEVPTVSGTLDFKPRDPATLLARLRQAAGLTDATKVIGTATAVPIPVHIVIKNPATGQPIKRFYVPDARFTIPGYDGKVLTKTMWNLPIESDSGTLLIYER